MAKLEFTLTKEKYDALSDELKAFYTTTKEGGYELEGVGSIQRALEAERKGKTEAVEKALRDALGDLDPEAARKAIAQQAAAEDEKLKAAGEFEKLREQLETRHKNDLEKVTAERNTILSNLKREKLANALTEKGVLPDRVKYLLGELDPQIELTSTDSGFQLKKIGGIGDAAEFEGIISSVKEASPFFFAANNTPGSGASGSNGNGGGQKQDLSSLPATARLTQLFEQNK